MRVGQLHSLPVALEGEDSTQDDVASLEELGLLWLPHQAAHLLLRLGERRHEQKL